LTDGKQTYTVHGACVETAMCDFSAETLQLKPTCNRKCAVLSNLSALNY